MDYTKLKPNEFVRYYGKPVLVRVAGIPEPLQVMYECPARFRDGHYGMTISGSRCSFFVQDICDFMSEDLTNPMNHAILHSTERIQSHEHQ